MPPQSELEIKGTFLAHPFAELIAEIGQSRLSGSLRATRGDNKCVVYFKKGTILFAVSNARTSRLFDLLIRRGRLEKKDLACIPNFQNDMELASALKHNELLTEAECNQLFAEQVSTIIRDLIMWTEGEWAFSALARVREGLAFPIDPCAMLLEFARCQPVEVTLTRFRSLNETFGRTDKSEMGIPLKPQEAFLLSRTGDASLTAKTLASLSGMAESEALQIMYSLWLAGLLSRSDWQAAFSPAVVDQITNVRLELKKEAKYIAVPVREVVEESPTVAEPPAKIPDLVLSLDEYLERVENAATHYDLLGVDPNVEIPALKSSYFALARMFHPDRYHAEGGETLRRVQDAFTKLAQAHETLKNDESRKVYDYKIRKDLTDREASDTPDNGDTQSMKLRQAADNFDRGFGLLVGGNPADAVPFLARSAHLAPANARYRAYYGKALSADAKQRHKAESEMQQALKIDPANPSFRILLAEFFIQYNLMKRAEGELNRLLKAFPDNREALDLLDKLKATA